MLIYCAKLSLLFFNRRITASSLGPWTAIHYVLLTILCIFALFSILTTIFPCRPIPAHYSLVALMKAIPTGLHCLSPDAQNNIQIASRGMHIASDLLLLSLPVLIISRLRISVRKRFGIILLFCFGIVCTIASILRIIMYRIPILDFSCTLPFSSCPYPSQTVFTANKPIGDSHPIFEVDGIDAGFACIIASLPAYYPVLNKLLEYVSIFSIRSGLSKLYGSRKQHHSGGSSSNRDVGGDPSFLPSTKPKGTPGRPQDDDLAILTASRHSSHRDEEAIYDSYVELINRDTERKTGLENRTETGVENA